MKNKEIKWVVGTCEYCKKPFMKHAYVIKRFCSDDCRKHRQRKKPSIAVIKSI